MRAYHAHAAPISAALVQTASTQVLVSQHGLTLYVFSADKPNKSVCFGGCAKYWPPALLPKGATLPSGVAGAHGKFGVTKRADGSRQLTYDGAPLYTWIKDKKQGDMTGQGVEGVWWVVTV